MQYNQIFCLPWSYAHHQEYLTANISCTGLMVAYLYLVEMGGCFWFGLYLFVSLILYVLHRQLQHLSWFWLFHLMIASRKERKFQQFVYWFRISGLFLEQTSASLFCVRYLCRLPWPFSSGQLHVEPWEVFGAVDFEKYEEWPLVACPAPHPWLAVKLPFFIRLSAKWEHQISNHGVLTVLLQKALLFMWHL